MYTSESINLKSQVINNIMMQMAAYVDKAAVDILQRVLEEQFVFLNVEQISTLPAEIDRSAEEKNRYLIGLYQVKKRKLSPKTLEQYLRSIRSLAAVIDKPYTDMDELDIVTMLKRAKKRRSNRQGVRRGRNYYGFDPAYADVLCSAGPKEVLAIKKRGEEMVFNYLLELNQNKDKNKKNEKL